MLFLLFMNLDGQNRIGIRKRNESKRIKGELNEDTANCAKSVMTDREYLDQELKKIYEMLKQSKNVPSK